MDCKESLIKAKCIGTLIVRSHTNFLQYIHSVCLKKNNSRGSRILIKTLLNYNPEHVYEFSRINWCFLKASDRLICPWHKIISLCSFTIQIRKFGVHK